MDSLLIQFLTSFATATPLQPGGCARIELGTAHRDGPYSAAIHHHLYGMFDATVTCGRGLDWINLQPPPHCLSPAMTNRSPVLIDRSITQLESLAAFLTEEVQQPWTTALLPTSERHLCKEALLTISVLLPKLRSVRRAQTSVADPRPPACRSCDE